MADSTREDGSIDRVAAWTSLCASVADEGADLDLRDHSPISAEMSTQLTRALEATAHRTLGTIDARGVRIDGGLDLSALVACSGIDLSGAHVDGPVSIGEGGTWTAGCAIRRNLMLSSAEVGGLAVCVSSVGGDIGLFRLGCSGSVRLSGSVAIDPREGLVRTPDPFEHLAVVTGHLLFGEVRVDGAFEVTRLDVGKLAGSMTVPDESKGETWEDLTGMAVARGAFRTCVFAGGLFLLRLTTSGSVRVEQVRAGTATIARGVIGGDLSIAGLHQTFHVRRWPLGDPAAQTGVVLLQTAVGGDVDLLGNTAGFEVRSLTAGGAVRVGTDTGYRGRRTRVLSSAHFIDVEAPRGLHLEGLEGGDYAAVLRVQGPAVPKSVAAKDSTATPWRDEPELDVSVRDLEVMSFQLRGALRSVSIADVKLNEVAVSDLWIAGDLDFRGVIEPRTPGGSLAGSFDFPAGTIIGGRVQVVDGASIPKIAAFGCALNGGLHVGAATVREVISLSACRVGAVRIQGADVPEVTVASCFLAADGGMELATGSWVQIIDTTARDLRLGSTGDPLVLTSLRGSRLSGAKVHNAELAECSFGDVDLSDAKLTSCSFEARAARGAEASDHPSATRPRGWSARARIRDEDDLRTAPTASRPARAAQIADTYQALQAAVGVGADASTIAGLRFGELEMRRQSARRRTDRWALGAYRWIGGYAVQPLAPLLWLLAVIALGSIGLLLTTAQVTSLGQAVAVSLSSVVGLPTGLGAIPSPAQVILVAERVLVALLVAAVVFAVRAQMRHPR